MVHSSTISIVNLVPNNTLILREASLTYGEWENGVGPADKIDVGDTNRFVTVEGSSLNGTAGSAIYDASPSGTAYRVSWASPTSGANTVTAEPVQDVVTPQYLTRGRLVCSIVFNKS